MIPILYIGAPGVGKTATVESQFDYVEKILLSTYTEEDIAGLPYRDGDKELRTKPQFLENLQKAVAKKKTTCLFLDELDKARREVADTLLTLVQSRSIGNWSLPDSTRIVAAANTPEWGGGDGISKAMQTRFSIVDFTPDIKVWSDWAREKFKNNESALNFISQIEIGRAPFLESNGEDFNFRLTCPRTIDNALMVMCDDHINHATKVNLVRGLLTSNTASLMLSVFKTDKDSTDSFQSKARRMAFDFKKEQGKRKPYTW